MPDMIHVSTRPPAGPFAGLAATVALLCSQGAIAAPAESGNPGRISDRILAAVLDANGVPGMGAAIWHQGELVWAGGAGYRDAENRLPVESDTIFRLASVSKILALAAAARLREQGRLDVDRPVQASLDYLNPEWPAMTARQLAAHTAGIPHYQKVDESRGGRHFTSVRESVGVFSDRDLLFAPGADYSYSSYGYTLLSAVVERSAGKPYLDYLADEIVPGLTIGPDVTDRNHPAASKAYIYDGGAPSPAAPHDYSYSWGGAGLGATAGDLARFGGRMLSGAIVSRATFDWMLEPARLTDGSVVMEDEFPVGFGLRGGADSDGERIAHHAGATIGARSVLLLYPDRQLAVSILSNAPWVSAIEQTAITLSAPFRSGGAEPAPRPCPTSARRYDGTFAGKRVSGTASFAVEDGICSGTIAVDKAMADWFDGGPQKDARSIRIIGLDERGGLARAAFVTPFGAYDLRSSPAKGDHSVRFNGTRSLAITFR